MTDTSILTETTEIITREVDFVLVEGLTGPKGDKGDPGSSACNCLDDGTVREDATFSSQKIMELLYPFVLNSFSISPSIAELGSTVSSVTLSWATNYPPDTVTLDNGVGQVTLPATNFTHSGQNITANRTYNLTAVRNGVPKNASATIAFLNRVFWGEHTSQTTDENILKAMQSQVSGARARSVTYNCSGGKYFHLAYPKRLGIATFKINNLSYSDMTMTEITLTNQYGYTEPYYVFFCNVIQFGAAITLVVQ